ncbi:hypothetical protein Taro_025955 [Colocasia esculenta]|uniref:Uncharacterized protein n=1 Tax=Colocasia esculenta TaxID=4460 RepID=A0A843VJ52_COLES|nr:hypothetical protein [Colocasia esculenta]
MADDLVVKESRLHLELIHGQCVQVELPLLQSVNHRLLAPCLSSHVERSINEADGSQVGCREEVILCREENDATYADGGGLGNGEVVPGVPLAL